MTLDHTGLVLACLRAALPSGTTVESQISNQFERVPYVHVRTAGGTGDIEYLDRPIVEIDCYTQGAPSAAIALGQQVRLVLHAAWRSQTVFAGKGHFAYVRALSIPHGLPLPGTPAGYHISTSTYEIGMRPPQG
ncbi:hypothetical protein EV193_104365 [Herbihabitans rhizosphaerae]|uniref:Tail terminator n=1 Tax=Herbihabitans rhizosphaerae TaxID=1872711 RepID=A0A4Q7KQP6_9PSEU|nr:hypothetical protein [Herbihabitans rhizosphaerae]RZS39149.1 hypothetical protein EV193_104365 [Herbihabitans rhizosphaerae]